MIFQYKYFDEKIKKKSTNFGDFFAKKDINIIIHLFYFISFFMKILEQIKKWIFQWIGIILVIAISWVSYAAWTSLSTETDWSILNATKWNAVINRLNSINQKSLATAWVNFDWTSCTWWAWSNECTIRDSYNVSKVIRTLTWRFKVVFLTPMDNSNYSANYTAWFWWDTNLWILSRSDVSLITNNSCEFASRHWGSDNNFIVNNIVFFWWKN